ncbi:transcription factor bHLH25-like isoform X2 [Prosopis cineraria]|uniref:transcription factor bHLH25-like isoform X2 n=1 Tax=Prosopis cineraria TaxID=364024 RepID=UPI00240F942A|nr:transcription factor bHLH25-like isoform X2 [Prosopis cineraria]
MKASLASSSDEATTLKMIISFAASLPNGEEEGFFYGVNMRSTNFLILCARLRGKNSHVSDLDREEISFPPDLLDAARQGMEDLTLCEEFPMDCFDGLDFQSLVPESYSPYERPNSQRKQNPQSIIAPPGPSPSKKVKVINKSVAPRLISFEHSNNTHQLCDLDPNVKLESLSENVLNLASLRSCQGAYYEGIDFVEGKKETRNPLQAQDHVMAERRRREKLNQKFITLSSIIPGLKKMDKASVLGDAIEYVKQLKEREKILEEQVAMNRKESAVLTRRTILFADDDDKSPPSDEIPDKSLAEIEARVLGKDVLIRIQCEKHNGCEAKILREFENLRLTVHSSSILPFGETTLCITIIAQMDKEHSMTAKDLVGSLRKALTLDRA